ncbi:M20 family metallopeptidase [Cupriavidus taiwanensis]|uniref:Glutamate carboxypeptidase Peptidase, M20/M25/M40 family similar to Pseudomonas cpg2 n=1 Tax=Cupriavidus taiwanensis (strain DSM 17343 / BCRC 17206 / CCUG 44338 / CIP 107171 / LMG 19424 / R1) TaxID=977880 RepID=B3RC58_CUPTR|nr:M20 family metallopeptidase [Cupriavidus taiwanensis]CAQ72483.1 Glutamate carboxypeptidase; Peptidase, M20/M25/M40 family; similar to Pseudomonas cpg2 [Cupriavidus taiwanensis LMG 19424]SOY64582.1 Glutamate carboxypeptidase; Peptidase, M20/M25/M40 family; similar to Pseudomonas cpg2 [Cupriavidus taiwanensis]
MQQSEAETQTAYAAVDWLAGQRPEMEALLGRIVDIDSGSRQEAGVAAVAQTLRAHLDAAGIATELHPVPGYGVLLDALVPGTADDAPVVLMGHMDTVYPAGTVARRPFRVEHGRAYGPGVADMKSGLVLNVFVAEALARCGGNTRPVRLFFSCDEEIGSPATRERIMDVARGAHAVFNAEPGRVSGNLVTERKGSMVVAFEVEGVAAHSGINHAHGASAIDALARKILALHALTDPERGITTNVGQVQGGIVANMVAPHAKAELDVRYTAETELDALYATIREIIERESLPRTRGWITDTRRTLPMARTPDALLALYQRGAQQLGFAVNGEFTGGAADSGLTASVGTPTLCGTGPVGGHPHTEREYCELSTFVPRAQALALAVIGLR